MEGLYGAISDRLPESWNFVLRKNRCRCAFISAVYKSLPDYYKGKYGFREGLKRITYMYLQRRDIRTCFDYTVMSRIQNKPVKECIKFWNEIYIAIITYEFNMN